MRLLQIKIFFGVLSICLVIPAPVFAVTNLVKIQIKNGSQVELSFDQVISKKQLSTEFFKDIIQLSLSDVSIYPAKILHIPGAVLKKIFAYQYNTGLVRCRLNIKGDAKKFQDQFEINPSGKVLTLSLRDSQKDVLVSAASAQRQEKESPEEKVLIENVLKKTQALIPQIQVQSPTVRKETTKKPYSFYKPMRSFSLLMGVLLLLGVLACGLRFLFKKRNKSGVYGVGQIFKKISGLNFGNKEKMIEVVSHHYLGPQKSIMVVKISGKLLVLGVSQDSINLITQLGDGESSEMDFAGASGTVAAEPPVFFEMLRSESSKPSIRSQVKSKVEGLKPL